MSLGHNIIAFAQTTLRRQGIVVGFYSEAALQKLCFDVALDLLKRHSGIVWDPGRFAGLLRGGDDDCGRVLFGSRAPLQTKSAGLPGITRQRVGLPLKIFD